MKLPKEIQDRIKTARKEVRRLKAQQAKAEARADARREKLVAQSRAIMAAINKHDDEVAEAQAAHTNALSAVKAPFMLIPELSRNFTPSAIMDMLK